MNDETIELLKVLQEAKEFAQMETVAREHIAKDEKDGKAWSALGIALDRQGKDGFKEMEMAVFLLPNDCIANFNMGTALSRIDRPREGIAYLRRAIAINPNYVPAFCNLGNAYKNAKELHKAMHWYWEGIKRAPHLVYQQNNMGNALMALGRHDEAMKMYRMAVEIQPDFIEAHGALLFNGDLMASTTVSQAQETRRAWAARFCGKFERYTTWANDLYPERRLRIGYVSADLREHSAARSFGSVLVNHDHAKFEIFCYDNSDKEPDHYSEIFQRAADHWIDVSEMTDDEFCDRVREDRIDVLVDLSGHSGGKRLFAFARKPAPVSVTAWGYANGTGIKEIDAFFADRVIVPEEERSLYAEEVRYLPCVVGSFWVEKFPDVGPLRASTNDGKISFGSLNRFSKVTPETLALWARVLSRVPASRMILKAAELADPAMRERLLEVFAKHNIEPERIVMVGATDWVNHIAVYDDIDICLDPFPHGGGVTTLEGLMMGVPIVTLRWPSVPGRLSAAILTAMGMTDWIAETEQQYEDIAVQHANDLKGLAALRAGLRERFKASPLGDGKAYCDAVEEQYRDLWRKRFKVLLDTKEKLGV